MRAIIASRRLGHGTLIFYFLATRIQHFKYFIQEKLLLTARDRNICPHFPSGVRLALCSNGESHINVVNVTNKMWV